LYGDLFVVLSAPSKGVFSSSWLDPLSGLVFPLLAFSVGLLAVFWAADQAVVRWIVYLQRIADIYARGRFTVRPLQAEAAPPEIRQLAETLDEMAAAIVARDTTLQENLTQKDDLLREIHHRVKNNLQVISSLLSMQERALTDPGARQAINDTRQRITALALIYRALYQGSDLRHADLRPFLEELTAQLMMTETANGTVRLEVRADPLIIDPDKLAPVALFAVEAITNAQKHGLADRGGTLTVDFKVDGPEATLNISDNGGGLRPPMETLEAKGVGRTLMTAFSRQLRGRTEMAINPAGGLTVTLVFPTPESVN
jgi:two-component sensor histidine kinase